MEMAVVQFEVFPCPALSSHWNAAGSEPAWRVLGTRSVLALQRPVNLHLLFHFVMLMRKICFFKKMTHSLPSFISLKLRYFIPCSYPKKWMLIDETKSWLLVKAVYEGVRDSPLWFCVSLKVFITKGLFSFCLWSLLQLSSLCFCPQEAQANFVPWRVLAIPWISCFLTQ